MNDIKLILQRVEQGDPTAAADLLPLVYEELRRLAAHKMAREKAGQILEATALVHEAWQRTSNWSRSGPVPDAGRGGWPRPGCCSPSLGDGKRPARTSPKAGNTCGWPSGTNRTVTGARIGLGTASRKSGGGKQKQPSKSWEFLFRRQAPHEIHPSSTLHWPRPRICANFRESIDCRTRSLLMPRP